MSILSFLSVLFLNDEGPGVLVKSDNFREKWEN